MSQTATVCAINYQYDANGNVVCENPRGLIFFLRAEPPAPKAEAKPAWTPVAATREVEVKRQAEPQPIVEKTQPIPAGQPAFTPVAATREVDVKRQAEPAAPARATGLLPEVPQPGEEAPKGWFGKLFKK